MKKLSLRTIICGILCIGLCISMFEFLYQFMHESQLHNDRYTIVAVANKHAIPTGIYTMFLILISAVFIFSIHIRKTNWTLILFIISYGSLAVNTITNQSGSYFLPEQLYSALSWRGVQYIPSHVILLYMLLNPYTDFCKKFLRALIHVTTLLGCCFLVSFTIHGAFYCIMRDLFADIFLHGNLMALFMFVTHLLLFSCTIIAIYNFILDCYNTKMQENALQLKDDLLQEGYHILQNNVNQYTQQLETVQERIQMLQSKLTNGYYNNLSKDLQNLSGLMKETKTVTYCDNEIVNLLLTYYSTEAEKDNIQITIEANVPQSLDCPSTDLSSFLINLLDNAFEGNRRIQPSEQRFIRLKLHYENQLLSVICENAYNECLKKDFTDNLLNTKDDMERTAFGLEQMKLIAKKYHSTLSIQSVNHVYCIHTTLHFDEKA